MKVCLMLLRKMCIPLMSVDLLLMFIRSRFSQVKIQSVVYWVTELFNLVDEYSPTRQQGILFIYDLFNVTVRLYNVKW
jgi:hypothetical protein